MKILRSYLISSFLFLGLIGCTNGVNKSNNIIYDKDVEKLGFKMTYSLRNKIDRYNKTHWRLSLQNWNDYRNLRNEGKLSIQEKKDYLIKQLKLSDNEILEASFKGITKECNELFHEKFEHLKKIKSYKELLGFRKFLENTAEKNVDDFLVENVKSYNEGDVVLDGLLLNKNKLIRDELNHILHKYDARNLYVCYLKTTYNRLLRYNPICQECNTINEHGSPECLSCKIKVPTI